MQFTVTRKYYKVIEVEADSVEEAQRKIEEEYLFEDVKINGFEDEIVSIGGCECSILLD